MTERERWIVYPLLFLALGAALRDKLFDRTTSKSIVCEELLVVDEDSVGRDPVRILAKIGRVESAPNVPSTGSFVVNGDATVTGQLLMQNATVADQLIVQKWRVGPALQILLRELQILLGGAQRTIPQELVPPDMPDMEPNRDK